MLIIRMDDVGVIDNEYSHAGPGALHGKQLQGASCPSIPTQHQLKRTFTESPGGPGSPIGPRGPGGPGSPNGPRGPGLPGGPVLPWKKEMLYEYGMLHGQRVLVDTPSMHSPIYTGVPGSPFRPGNPCPPSTITLGSP